MLKIKYPKYAFAIKFSRENYSLEHRLLFDLVEELAEKYVGFKVEGINSEKRVSNIEKKTPLIEIREDDVYTEIGIVENKLRDVIAVGVSSKYAVSFESLEDLTVNAACSIYSVPVYDLEKHYDLIVKKLKAFAKAHFVAKMASLDYGVIQVRHHSNFVRVSNSNPCVPNVRVDYEEEKETAYDVLKELLGLNKPKETKYNLTGMYVI